MARERNLTDSEVELEIERLKGSEYVHLAQKEIRLKQKRRTYMNQLRWLNRKGKELAEQGYTLDNIESMIEELEQASRTM